MSLRFCGRTLDLDARRLFCGRDEVHLSPKAFETLRVLVEHRPRALSKSELLKRVWPDVIVSEISVARVINEIRQKLGDDQKDRIIRTVHSHGYAFVARIKGPGAEGHPQRGAPVCWLVSATRTLPLHEGIQFIGRDPALDLFLDSPKISRRHALIEVRGDEVTIQDLGSKNGSFVGNVRVETRTRLRHGDDVHIGRFMFTVRLTESLGSTETED